MSRYLLFYMPKINSVKFSQFFFNITIFSLPIFIILWGVGIWICFFGIIGSYIILLHGKNNEYLAITKNHYMVKPYSYILLIFFAYFIFSLASVIFSNSPPKSIENAIIFLLWLAISPIIAVLAPSSRVLGFGCLAAVIIALLITINQFYFLNIPRPYGMYGGKTLGSGAIKFGDMSVLLGILSWVLLSKDKAKNLGKLAAFIGIVICLYAGARGGIFAVFLCTIIWLFFTENNRLSWRLILSAILGAGTLFFILNKITNNYLINRFSRTFMELILIYNNNLDSSIGVRLQLWKAALIMFENNPVLGVGLNNFYSSLLLLNSENRVSNLAAKLFHAHNEYFCSLATGGIIGFIITLLLFLIPITLFKKSYHENVWVKAGFWGICLISFFALSECMFDKRATIFIFIILISICMAGSISVKQLKAL
ncbi:MAG: O-antigen ligase family protein [Methylococcaceae bacterium]